MKHLKLNLLKIICVLCCLRVATSQQSETRVVIVGAGLSGYAAAAKLLENGVDDIVILEAEDRIGGRVHSIPFRGGRIDMGAQWVHGQGKNSIYEFINKGFEFGDTGFDDAYQFFHQSDGLPVVQQQCQLLANLSEHILYKSFDEMAEFDHSLGDFFAMKYTRGLRERSLIEVPWSLARQMEDFYHSVKNYYAATENWHQISASIYGNMVRSEGKQWLTWRASGFATVFDFLSKRLPNPSQAIDVESKVILNKTVLYMDWDREKPLVMCTDGSTYTADHVIFTGSLGVLKRFNGRLFRPQLPLRNFNAVQNVAFGSLEKMFLEFTSPFWPQNDPDWVQYSILWTQEDVIAVTGTDREWLLDLNAIFEVDAFPNLLSFFLIGQRFTDFDQMSDTKFVDDVMWLLERMLGGRLPRPSRTFRSSWISQENFLGSYSFMSVETARNNVSYLDLAAPLVNSDGNAKVFFAGEHTDEIYSYANGAVSSGWRAGEEVLAEL